MNDITLKKLEALNEVVNAYEVYRGGKKSRLEEEINNLEFKLDETELNNLKVALQNYKKYFLNIMANSRRVHISFKTPEITDLQELVDFDDEEKGV